MNNNLNNVPQEDPTLKEFNFGQQNNNSVNTNAGMQNNFNNMNNTSMSNTNPNNSNNTVSLNIDKGLIKKIGIGIAGLIGVIILIVIIKGLGSGGHTNNTGGDYKASEVSYNCYKKEDNGETYIDVLFDVEGSNGQTVQLVAYYKVIRNDITDTKYREIVENLDTLYCRKNYNKSDCSNEVFPNHIDIGISSLGWNTVADRNGNNLTVTAYQMAGVNQKASKEDKEQVVSSFVSQGYTCK